MSDKYIDKEKIRSQVSNLLKLWGYDDDGNNIGEETDK